MATFLNRSNKACKKVKEKLKNGDLVTLIHPNHNSPTIVEKVGEFGFDAVLIDCEHGAAGPKEVEEMARAANLAGMISIVRPEDAIPWMITKYIECGADGVMVPLVSDAKTAKAIVDRIRLSAPFDYDEKFVILMIETIEAINNLPEILKVEGVDAYLIAPGDLAVTMGHTPYSYEWHSGERAQEVTEVIDNAIKLIVKEEKVCGTLVNRGDACKFLDKGVRLIYDHVNHMLSYGCKDFFNQINHRHVDKNIESPKEKPNATLLKSVS